MDINEKLRILATHGKDASCFSIVVSMGVGYPCWREYLQENIHYQCIVASFPCESPHSRRLTFENRWKSFRHSAKCLPKVVASWTKESVPLAVLWCSSTNNSISSSFCIRSTRAVFLDEYKQGLFKYLLWWFRLLTLPALAVWFAFSSTWLSPGVAVFPLLIDSLRNIGRNRDDSFGKWRQKRNSSTSWAWNHSTIDLSQCSYLDLSSGSRPSADPNGHRRRCSS